jgi:hypothetical protein
MTDPKAELIGVTTLLIVLTTLFVAVRAFVRIRIFRSVWWDDGESSLGYHPSSANDVFRSGVFELRAFIRRVRSEGDESDETQSLAITLCSSVLNSESPA